MYNSQSLKKKIISTNWRVTDYQVSIISTLLWMTDGYLLHHK